MKKVLMNHSFLKKLLLNNILVVTITILLISTINYYYNTSSNMKQIAKSYEKLLLQADFSIESLYNRMFEVGEQLYNDKYVTKGLYAQKIDPQDVSNMNTRLNEITGSIQDINSLYLYNSEYQRFIHTITRNVDIPKIDKDVMTVIKERQKIKKMVFQPHVQHYFYEGKEYKANILSLVFLYSSSPSDNALFINLKQEAVLDLFKSMNSAQASAFIVFDENGQVILHSEKPELYMTNIKNQHYAEKIMQSKLQNGSFIDTIDKHKSLFTYIHNQRLGWYMVSVTAQDILVGDSLHLQKNIVIVSILILILGIFFSTVSMKQIYTPFGKVIKMLESAYGISRAEKETDDIEYMNTVINSMLSKITTLEDVAIKNHTKLKQSFLKDLLTGSMSYDEADIRSKLRQMDIVPAGSGFRIVIFKIDKHDIAKFNSDDGLDMIKNTINDLTFQVFGTNQGIEQINMSLNEIVFFFYSDIPQRLETVLMKIIVQVEKLMNIHILIGIGSCADTVGNLPNSYENAKEALEYRYLFKEQKLFDYDEIIQNTESSYVYPLKLENKLIEAIKVNSINQCKDALNEFFLLIQHCQISSVNSGIRQLTTAIEGEFSALIDLTFFYTNYKQQNIERIVNRFEYCHEVKEFLSDLCIYIIEKLKQDRNKSNIELIAQADKYIQDNYWDGNICAEVIASKLNISTQYFSKLFNKTMNTSYSNYITEVRLKKAEELLKTNKYNISEVCEKVGFSNSSYFITLFKKHYGISPKQYQQRNIPD